MNRDKKVLLTFIVAMLGAIAFAAAQNLFYEIWNYLFNLGFLSSQRVFYPKSIFDYRNPLAFWEQSNLFAKFSVFCLQEYLTVGLFI